MTPDLRKSVVELLYEAADKYSGIAEAYGDIYKVDIAIAVHERSKHPVWDMAVRAREAVLSCWKDWSTEGYPSYETCCMHAAGLIEESNWWPE